jgi:DDE superfamily endonuclease
MLVATWSGSLLPWEQELTAFKAQLSSAFGRAELRRSASAFIDGLLSGVARKTGWQLAEQAGLERPYRLQSLLGRSSWQADRLRDLVRTDVLATLGDAGGVLVVDETGFLKKGMHSVGVARQYSGTAGRVENCQVGVFVAYASRFGQALIDRRLYLPEAWANDAARRRGAAVPETVAFQTKPAIAAEMIAAGARCRRTLCVRAGGCALRGRLPHPSHAGGTPAALRAGDPIQSYAASADERRPGTDRSPDAGRCVAARGLDTARRR